MTREEHIENLETIGCDGWTVSTEAYKSLQWAIEALEQEPCGDLISLETVIEWLKAKDIIKMSSQEETARRELKDLPPVKQEPKTGHWEYGYAFADGNYCKCSECKEIIKCIYPMHYCPKCGVKMVEPQERSEKE